ncbi:MAG TPA: thioredoxin [Bacilli bacterium]|nr:thioredoxin [Bacilli bacterium]
MIIHDIDETKFGDYIKNGIVVVDFFATWCGPCKMLAPELETVSKEMNINIIKVDVDKYQMLAQKYGVMSVPTLYVFKNGTVVGNRSGYMPKDMLKEWIESLTK